MNDLERDMDEWFIAYLEEQDPRYEWTVTTTAREPAHDTPHKRRNSQPAHASETRINTGPTRAQHRKPQAPSTT